MKRTKRTSKSHPLQIATIKAPGIGAGDIGLTICPGKKDTQSLTGIWHRDLAIDLAAIKEWGATAVVCLVEAFELEMLKVSELPKAVVAAGMQWFHLPIRDVDVPDASFEKAWRTQGKTIRQLLIQGDRVLIHCRGGLGRSGTVAGRLLIELGMGREEAVATVRRQRPGAIETSAQEEYVRKTKPLARRSIATRASSTNEERAIGCLLGLAIGDALGTTLEFSARDSLPAVSDLIGGGPFNLKPGEWTDDTSMALCLADSLLARRDLDPADLISRFQRWRDCGHNSVTGHCFDIGITTSQSISRFAADGNPLAGSLSPDAAGNGSIMRLAPVPIYFSGDEAKAEIAAVLQGRTTHGAPECLDACRLMTLIVVRLINGVSWQQAIAVEEADFPSPKVKALAAGAWKIRKRPQIRSTGYVIDTLEAALWAVETTSTFAEAVLLAVNLGGDADTVGAVAGQLAGARYGYRGTPKKWIKRLAWSDRIIALARDLHRVGARK